MTKLKLKTNESMPTANKMTLKLLGEFCVYVLRRYSSDRCLRLAASLSYTSLLAIVPLTVIAFSMLAAFPVFGNIRDELQSVVFANLLPESAQAMEQYFNQFLKNSSTLSSVGIVGLAVTAILLLGTVETSMNRIFRVTTPRALVPRLMVFWALLTLGPLLLGASFSLSAYIFAATASLGIELGVDGFGIVTLFMPTLIIMILLAAFYLVIPNRPVSRTGAVAGGIVAGLLFSLLRILFGLYVSSFPTYQTIYGAVSVIPIFLIWMYMSWAVVLVGASITASVGEWKNAGGSPVQGQLRSGRKVALAVHVVDLLFQASHRGGGVHRRELLGLTGINETVLNSIMEGLESSRFVIKTARDEWVLCRDLGTTTLNDLYLALGLGLQAGDITMDGAGWRHRLREQLDGLKQAQASALSLPLRDLLAAAEDVEKKSQTVRSVDSVK